MISPINRKMPLRLFNGDAGNWPLDTFINRLTNENVLKPQALYPHSRYVFGYRLPDWQRPAVWTAKQQERFIESCYLGLDIGRFVVTQANFDGLDGPLDNLLIDGQQRLMAIEAYLKNVFPVFGYQWNELGELDKRLFFRLTLPVIKLVPDQPWNAGKVDEAFLKDLYTRMNYGGTPHAPEHHPNVLEAQP